MKQLKQLRKEKREHLAEGSKSCMKCLYETKDSVSKISWGNDYTGTLCIALPTFQIFGRKANILYKPHCFFCLGTMSCCGQGMVGILVGIQVL